MKCSECVMYWISEEEEYPSCHADPDWPAPCEIEEEEDFDDV